MLMAVFFCFVSAVPQARKASLALFLEKRKERYNLRIHLLYSLNVIEQIILAYSGLLMCDRLHLC
jgi:hypothetical protein